MAAQQDPVSVDPQHYTIEVENERVRVLRISYGPRERSEMHSRPDSIAVFLTGVSGRFSFPDGTTADISGRAGEVVWLPATTHLPENLTDQPFELVQIELKG